MALRPLVCFCCGADITAPQFFQGKAYGYTCIKKVSGQKQVKNKCEIYAQGTVITLTDTSITVEIEGFKFTEEKPVYVSRFQYVKESGIILLVDKNNNPIFRCLSVTKLYNVETKLYDVTVSRKGVTLATKSYK